MKTIGIISDTHSFWDDKYLTYFEPCDEIWHAGDILLPIPCGAPRRVQTAARRLRQLRRR